MTTTVHYSFWDAADQRPVSRSTRGAIRGLLRDAGFRSVGTPREAIWERHGSLDGLASVMSNVVSAIQRRGGQTLRELTITIR
ncbi:MAG: hypothetical protein ACTHOE_12620 [Conexibacter sp.]